VFRRYIDTNPSSACRHIDMVSMVRCSEFSSFCNIVMVRHSALVLRVLHMLMAGELSELVSSLLFDSRLGILLGVKVLTG